MYLLYIIY